MGGRSIRVSPFEPYCYRGFNDKKAADKIQQSEIHELMAQVNLGQHPIFQGRLSRLWLDHNALNAPRHRRYP
jgi:hypothetical protein